MFKPTPLITSAAFAALTLVTGTSLAQTASDGVVLVQAGRLLDRPGQKPRSSATIVVRNGRIEAVRDGFVGAEAFAGAKVIDLRDRFVLPGLIDCHVHLDSDKAGQEGLVEALTQSLPYYAYEAEVNARKTLQAGFTTVRNLGNYGGVTLALRDAIAAGKVAGPRIVDAGEGISSTSGHGDGRLGLNPGNRRARDARETCATAPKNAVARCDCRSDAASMSSRS